MKRLLRCRSLLGALVLRACYVAARSWEPWCSEMFTLPLVIESLGVESLRQRSLLATSVLILLYVTPFDIGSLGVESLLRHRSLLGALV